MVVIVGYINKKKININDKEFDDSILLEYKGGNLIMDYLPYFFIP